MGRLKSLHQGGLVTHQVGNQWITHHRSLSVGELNAINSAAGESRQESLDRYIGKFLFGRKDNPLDTDIPLEVFFDQGNPRWLKEQQEDCEEAGFTRTHTGTMVPRRFGSVTAYLSRQALFSVSLLKWIPGLNGEERHIRQESFDYLNDYFERHNHLPLTESGKQYAPFINVWCDGSWWVNEGNHRIKVAAAHGWRFMPVEIRWYSGGEKAITEKSNRFSIAEVMQQDKLAHQLGFTANKFRGKL